MGEETRWGRKRFLVGKNKVSGGQLKAYDNSLIWPQGLSLDGTMEVNWPLKYIFNLHVYCNSNMKNTKKDKLTFYQHFPHQTYIAT